MVLQMRCNFIFLCNYFLEMPMNEQQEDLVLGVVSYISISLTFMVEFCRLYSKFATSLPS